MLSPPPEVGLALAGIDPSSPVAGVGQVTIVAAAREPALILGLRLALGGMWGVLLAQAREASPAG